MGQYQCELVFYPGTDDEQRFKPPPLTVTGKYYSGTCTAFMFRCLLSKIGLKK